MTQTAMIFCDRCGAANRAQASFCRACGNSLRPTSNGSSPTLNSTINIYTTLTGQLNQQHTLKQRYVVLTQVGQGGFGAVYKASDTQFGNRVVAVKEMSQRNLGIQELVEASAAFKQEALLLAGLTHPNLPRIYEQFTDTGRSYLVMDFIEGETLETVLNNLHGGKLPIERVLHIGLQLCSVLDYLHTRQPPIIFRDLKPANVMITANGHVYLIDFGIARHFKPGQAKDTSALGSSGYAPPEQYGKSQTTPRADIYSLGATLHQMLSGDDPADSPFRFSPLHLDPQFALTDLEKLIMEMVNVDLTKRPASVTLVRQELQRALAQHSIATTNPLPNSPSSVYQATATPKKSRTRKTQPAIRPQLNMLYACRGHSGRVTALAWSPDGKHIASASYDKSVQLWEAASGQHLQTYSGHPMRVNSLSWAPNGQFLASGGDDASVQIWNIATGQSTSLRGHTAPVNAVAWSPDGKYIASASSDKLVHVWDLQTKEIAFSYRAHTDKVLCAAWSPDSKRLASAGKDRKIHIWDPSKEPQKRTLFSTILSLTRRQEVLPGHHGQINDLAWSPQGTRIASVSNDRYALVQDPLTGATLFSQGSGNSYIKNTIAWSPTGKHLAIGGNDKTVQIWNLATNTLTFTYRGHTGYVLCLAWSPDNTRIVSAGVDRIIQVWQAL